MGGESGVRGEKEEVPEEGVGEVSMSMDEGGTDEDEDDEEVVVFRGGVSGDSEVRSVVEDCGCHRSSCGYCKRVESSVSHGVMAQTLTVDDYQALIDRGWRRSGRFVYKPVMEATCCPQYTIRLEADKFQERAEHRKVRRRAAREAAEFCGEGGHGEGEEEGMGEGENGSEEDGSMGRCWSALAEALGRAVEAGEVPEAGRKALARAGALKRPRQGKKAQAKEAGGASEPFFVSTLAHAVCGAVRGEGGAEVGSVAVALAKWVPEGFGAEAAEHTGMIRVWEKGAGGDAGTGGGARYSAAKKNKTRKAAAAAAAAAAGEDGVDWLGGNIDVQMVPARWSQESYEVYKAYQIKVHGDPPGKLSPMSYRRFLVDSPLIPRAAEKESDPPLGYGSFHVEYRLKGKADSGAGKLFAVGVVDVLPLCLSSVYLYYDPDFGKMTPGKLSALWEIRWVAERARLGSMLRYYYMGYYIHSCSKMRYKGAYRPSELLCPETKEWFPLDACVPLLDATPYVALGKHLSGGQPRTCPPSPPLSPSGETEAGQGGLASLHPHARAIFRIPVMLDKRVYTFGSLVQHMRVSPPTGIEGILQQIGEYLALVGEALGREIVYVLR